MNILELEIYGLPGFPENTKYLFSKKVNILSGQDGEKLKMILQAIQFMLDPVLENLMILPEKVQCLKENAFIEVTVMIYKRTFRLRRNLRDPAQAFINQKSVSIEEFYRTIADLSLSPQTVLLDGTLVEQMVHFTEKNWFDWMRLQMDFVESLDDEFGDVLDLCESFKRHTASFLGQTADRIGHLTQCVTIEKNVEALRAAKVERNLMATKITVDQLRRENFALLRLIRRQDVAFQVLQRDQLNVKNGIFFVESEKDLAEIFHHMSTDFSLEEPPGDTDVGIIDELSVLMRDLVTTSGETAQKIFDTITPNKDTSKYKRDFLILCLHLARISAARGNFREYGKLIDKLEESKTEVESNLSARKDEITAILVNVEENFNNYSTHIEHFGRNRKKLAEKVVQLNGKLNNYYILHLKMTDLLIKEDQCENQMKNLGLQLDIEEQLLAGVNYIDCKVADLVARGELPFPPDNYHGPLFRYLCFTKEMPTSVIQSITPILKPLYTTVLVETTDDAHKLLELAKDFLQDGKIVLNILPLQLFNTDRCFDEELYEQLPAAQTIYENLCENKFTTSRDSFRKNLFRNMLKRVVFCEVAEQHPGLIVVNREGDFVAEGGAIGGGSYATQLPNIPKHLRLYCAHGMRRDDLKREKASLMEDLVAYGEEVGRDRKQLCEKERLTFGIDLVREISKHLHELKIKMSDVASARRCLQRITHDLDIIQEGMKLVQDKALRSKDFYDQELNELQDEAAGEIPFDEELLNQIAKLHNDLSKLNHIANATDWRYNWYDSGPTFQTCLFKIESQPTNNLDVFEEKKETLVTELDKLEESYAKMAGERREYEMVKNTMRDNLETHKEMLKECNEKHEKYVAIPRVDREKYRDLSVAEIGDQLSIETEKFRQLTGHEHVYKISDGVKKKLSRWNNRLKNLTRKRELMSSTEHNEALIWSDYGFAAKQLQTLVSILKTVQFTRQNGKSFYFSFLLRKKSSDWFAFEGNSGATSKITSLTDICGLKWVVREGDTVTEFADVSAKDRTLCILVANYAMSSINKTPTFLIDLDSIKKCSSRFTEEDITSLFYSLINEHQVISISQVPIVDELFRNIAVE